MDIKVSYNPTPEDLELMKSMDVDQLIRFLSSKLEGVATHAANVAAGEAVTAEANAAVAAALANVKQLPDVLVLDHHTISKINHFAQRCFSHQPGDNEVTGPLTLYGERHNTEIVLDLTNYPYPARPSSKGLDVIRAAFIPVLRAVIGTPKERSTFNIKALNRRTISDLRGLTDSDLDKFWDWVKDESSKIIGGE